ncbi:MAG: type II toxin-antitoxin system RelE/ParE family toxin [Gemmataceae bacterium]
MSRIIVRSPRTEADLEEILDYLGRQSAQLAYRFLRMAETTFAFLAKSSDPGSPFDGAEPRLANLRYWPIKRFPNHLVFFRTTETELQIVRVLHGARNLEAIL